MSPNHIKETGAQGDRIVTNLNMLAAVHYVLMMNLMNFDIRKMHCC